MGSSGIGKHTVGLFRLVNLKKPKEYSDDTVTVVWGSQDKYEVLRQLGKGKYGEVYEGINLQQRGRGFGDNGRCVLKIMRPVKEHRLRREVKILQQVSGGPNIVQLLEVVRDPETKTPCFVFDLVNAISFKDLQASVTDLDVRYYVFQLLVALDFCHSRGIMHRDVKPGNVLIDHAKRQLKLIDWGLADFYQPGKEYPVRVATRFYKGPELLVDIKVRTLIGRWWHACMRICTCARNAPTSHPTHAHTKSCTHARHVHASTYMQHASGGL